jgi:microcompartment protein CcmK/EutM
MSSEIELEAEGEVVVASQVREVEPVRPAELVPAQAAAVAAGSFVAGALTMAVVKRRSARRAARRRPKRPVDMLPIVGSRSFLVDVHLISRD